jgi:hypothetical protein
MDIVERNITFFNKASKFFNIPLTSLFNHINGKTVSLKVGQFGVLSEEAKVIPID